MNSTLLFEGLPFRRVRPGEVEITSIETDSRSVRPGALFMAREGWMVDSHAFLGEALKAGAAALAVRHETAIPSSCDVPVWCYEEEDRDLGYLADRFFGAPTSDLRVVAITGTNGKSTCVAMVAWLLDRLGLPAARMGTVGYSFGELREVARNTTPDGRTIHGFAARARARGARALVMEASSHGIELERMAGVRVDVAAFTNLSHDHLDFHGDLASYEAAKGLLFSRDLAWARAEGKSPSAVVCVDEAVGEAMCDRVPNGVDTLRVGLGSAQGQDLRVVREGVAADGGSFFRVEQGDLRVRGVLPLPGDFNLQNLVVTLGIVERILPGRWVEAVALMAEFPGEAGRMERVAPAGPGEHPVRVDYAHSPDAVARASDAAGTREGLTVVVGCGGDRDAAKRPAMARAALGAAHVILTSDNPRSEDPEAILDAMMEGVPEAARSSVQRISDREEAIAHAVARASEGPVLILGKGHETTQEVGGRRLHFDDREVARRALIARREGLDPARVPRLRGWSAERFATVCGGAVVRAGSGEPNAGLSTDTRTLVDGGVFVALRGTAFDAHAFLDRVEGFAAVAVVERGRTPAGTQSRTAWIEVDCTRRALLDLASGVLDEARRSEGGFRVLGITGSNGKTSTRALATALAEQALPGRVLSTTGNWNNQVGMPLVVAQLAPCHRVAVLELGISERGDMDELAGAVQPDVAVVTSIAAAHTLGLGGVDGVREQKARIVRSSVRALAIPASEAHHAVWHERRPEGAELVTVGDGPAANVQVARAGAFGAVTLRGAIPEDLQVPLALPGDAMARNLALALVGVTRLLGETSVGTSSSVRSAMERVDLPGGRLERRVCGEWTLLDDSYNANPASVRAGLEVLASMPSPRIAVLGEMRELEGDLSAAHAEVGSWVDGRADVLVTVGELAGCAARAVAPSVEVVTCRDVAEAVSWFRSEAPASASIWVKGSRAAALDRLVHALVARTAEES